MNVKDAFRPFELLNVPVCPMLLAFQEPVVNQNSLYKMTSVRRSSYVMFMAATMTSTSALETASGCADLTVEARGKA